MALVSESDLVIIEQKLEAGKSLTKAMEIAGLPVTVETLVFLQKNFYDRLTDAKFGEGHAERQRELREEFKGG